MINPLYQFWQPLDYAASQDQTARVEGIHQAGNARDERLRNLIDQLPSQRVVRVDGLGNNFGSDSFELTIG